MRVTIEENNQVLRRKIWYGIKPPLLSSTFSGTEYSVHGVEVSAPQRASSIPQGIASIACGWYDDTRILYGVHVLYLTGCTCTSYFHHLDHILYPPQRLQFSTTPCTPPTRQSTDVDLHHRQYSGRIQQNRYSHPGRVEVVHPSWSIALAPIG